MVTRKVVYNAVAGSGKTSYIIDELDEKKRTLILTYTIINEQQIRSRIIKKFGYIPENIIVKKIFSFLYSFCLRPNLSLNSSIKGITFNHPSYVKHPSNKDDYFMTESGYVYSNKLSFLILKKEFNYIERLNKFFDVIYIDEFQDLSSDELKIAYSLKQFKGSVKLFGDFFQTTFSTSNRGNNMKNVKSSINNFLDSYKNEGYQIDTQKFISSQRCPSSVTQFINDKLNIPMTSKKSESYSLQLIKDKNFIDEIVSNNSIPKLFYSKSSSYKCHSMNWGESKGLTFENVCVILNATTFKHFRNDTLNQLASTTKNKFYVACTRASKNLYFIEEKQLKSYKL